MYLFIYFCGTKSLCSSNSLLIDVVPPSWLGRKENSEDIIGNQCGLAGAQNEQKYWSNR